jgi:uncharacterized protein YbjT (DUF2867 family)
MILVVGATGILGSELCRQLASRGDAVRALVRPTSNPKRVSALEALGVELALGDLKDAASLRDACLGVDTVVSTASSTLSRQAGDSIESVDGKGQLDLIAAAEALSVGRFVLVSFPGSREAFPLQDAKRAAEERLRKARMRHVILQPTCFMEIWLSPALGFDPANGRAQVFGNGSNAVSWISFLDVAAFAAAAARAPDAADKTLPLGGPDALSVLDAVRIAEQVTGKPINVQHVPEEALRAQKRAATDSLQQSMAGLALYCAGGDVIETAEAERLLDVRARRSVSDFLRASLAS